MLSVWKPWYVYRPSQLLRRLRCGVTGTPSGLRTVALPWGNTIEVDPREDVGRAIWTTGVYDLAVSEVLFRLTPHGALAIDAGANIGYMSGLLATRSGAGGRVLAFEPHPVLASRLRSNLARLAARPDTAPVQFRASALSSSPGFVNLQEADGQATNHGLAFVGTGSSGTRVPSERLDDVVGVAQVRVMKLDVEGHEEQVLRGASGLLGRHAIRHIVFEEHTGASSPTCRLLTDAGYRLYRIGWEMRGPVLASPDQPPICRKYEAPSFLATAAPEEVETVIRRRGWDIYR